MPERRRKRTNQDRGTDEVKQDRSLLLYVLLSFVTFSVYHFYFMDLWAKDVNILCEKDGKHTVGVEKMMLFSVLTFGVYKYVWLAEIVDRICDNAAEYDVEVRQDSETFFVWMILVPVLGYGTNVAAVVVPVICHQFPNNIGKLLADTLPADSA